MKIRFKMILQFAAIAIFSLMASGVHAQQDFCSQTADSLLTGCNAQANADADVKNAICINYSDTNERDECFSDLKDEKTEARHLCQQQHDWRLSACNLLGEKRYDPSFEPADFDSDFSNLTKPNPYFPLTIGDKWKYKGGGEVNTVEVTNQTKQMESGVNCIVIVDKVFTNGQLTESTNDWFAQALNGDVWYCGEDTREYETFPGDHPQKPELIDNEGSFKAGRDADKGGIIFLANPKKGKVYLEEFSLANAEDATVILSNSYSFGKDSDLDQLVPQALADRFCSNDCVVTKNFSLLEPGVIDRKYYAKGIGVFLEVALTAQEISQLVDCNFDSRCKNLPQP